MIDSFPAVVFSRDRALQLDAFLRSAELFAPFSSVHVIFRATGDGYVRGYELLQDAHPTVRWLPEASFRSDLLAVVEEIDDSYLAFHTDDDVYFEPVPPFEVRGDEICFTLRLGLNTTYCYPLDSLDIVHAYRRQNERISWEWRTQGPGAYAYPLSVNGHVFRRPHVRRWLEAVDFSNPNELEARLQDLNDSLDELRMAAFARSKVVSIPANLVNETFPNRHGALHSPRALNDRWLAGERLALARMDFGAVSACHQEIPLAFEPRPDQTAGATATPPTS